MASPLAKKLASEKGIDLSRVQGSGDHGRIIKRDVDNYQPQLGGGLQAFTPVGVESVTELANTQMRKTIAKRLSASKFSAPHYYLGVEFNMDNAIAFRSQYNSIPDKKISFNDIIVKAVALALRSLCSLRARLMCINRASVHSGGFAIQVASDRGKIDQCWPSQENSRTCTGALR